MDTPMFGQANRNDFRWIWAERFWKEQERIAEADLANATTDEEKKEAQERLEMARHPIYAL